MPTRFLAGSNGIEVVAVSTFSGGITNSGTIAGSLFNPGGTVLPGNAIGAGLQLRAANAVDHKIARKKATCCT